MQMIFHLGWSIASRMIPLERGRHVDMSRWLRDVAGFVDKCENTGRLRWVWPLMPGGKRDHFGTRSMACFRCWKVSCERWRPEDILVFSLRVGLLCAFFLQVQF